MNILWNAEKYKQNFSFVHQYGCDLLALIDFEKVKTAIDLGCGNGVLTASLKEKGIHVTGLDASPQQLETAKANYPDIPFQLADATDFSVEESVDLVFSNAVFHWIDHAKQRDMLNCVSKALRTGGQFVFEFGGYGNNALIHAALKEAFTKFNIPYINRFCFPSIGEYAPLVEQAGLRVKTALLFDRLTELKGPEGMRDWIDMFMKVPFEPVKDKQVAEQIKQQAIASLRPQLFIDGKWHADYVRLRMKAIKEET